VPVYLAGKLMAGSVSKKRHKFKGWGDIADKTEECPRRQDVSRAPQPDCALITVRMSDSRRLQYCVFAALQPIANHIHRPADYPADTPVWNITG
jgi:hypothetical protein